jgi:hypothetical protein
VAPRLSWVGYLAHVTGQAVDNAEVDDMEDPETGGGVVFVVEDEPVDVDETDVLVGVVLVVEVEAPVDIDELHVLLNRYCITVLAPWYVLSDDKSDKLV